MRRTIFTAEHEMFRETARSYYLRECAPHAEEWERDGQVSRAAWTAAGKAGLIGWQFPEEYGGQGIQDFRYNAIMAEEMHATGSVGIGLGLQNDVIPPYLTHLTTAEQKARWLPGVTSGETICALALSEPAAGSDLKGIRTTARRDGDEWVIDGSKTFITNGILADLVIVACKTDPEAGHKGISLIVVERGTEGFERGRKLDKVGMKAQDTAELFFHEVRVPAENLIGQEGRGFYHMMGNLPTERLAIAVAALASAERAFELALEYAKTRVAFGQADRRVPGQPLRARRHQGEARRGPRLSRRLHHGALRGRADRRGGRRRQVLDHGDRLGGHRPLYAALRWLWLRQRVRDRADLARQPGPAGVRRDLGDHAGDHRALAGTVSVSRALITFDK